MESAISFKEAWRRRPAKNLNPFVHKMHLNNYDKLKIIFVTIFILPIRIFCIIFLILFAYIITLIALIGKSGEDMREYPLSGWRRLVHDFICEVVCFIYFFFGFHAVRVRGKPSHCKEAPILVVAPHSSMFDVLINVVLGAPSPVAKGELTQMPIFSRFIDFTQPVYVWREDQNSRQNTISEIIRRANSPYDWPQVMIFPEGTCTNRSCLITFKPGAFLPGVPVQPVVIRYPNKTDCITWTWDGPSVAKIIWVTMCQFHNYCELEYLPVYNPSPEEKANPRLYAFNVRKVMADALDVPVADYTYDDCRVMHKARLKGLPTDVGLVEVQKLKFKYRSILSFKDVEGSILNEYASVCDKSGKLNLARFSKYINLPDNEPVLRQLFNFYAENLYEDARAAEICRKWENSFENSPFLAEQNDKKHNSHLPIEKVDKSLLEKEKVDLWLFRDFLIFRFEFETLKSNTKELESFFHYFGRMEVKYAKLKHELVTALDIGKGEILSKIENLEEKVESVIDINQFQKLVQNADWFSYILFTFWKKKFSGFSVDVTDSNCQIETNHFGAKSKLN